MKGIRSNAKPSPRSRVLFTGLVDAGAGITTPGVRRAARRDGQPISSEGAEPDEAALRGGPDNGVFTLDVSPAKT